MPGRILGSILSVIVPEWLRLLLGTLCLRSYVFGFLLVYLVAAAAAWGWRRAAAFTGLAAGLAFAAEWTSTRVGVPFGLYRYTGLTVGRELYLGNVPVFDPLSFAFLAYASLGVAGLVLARHRWITRGKAPGRVALAATAGILMMWLDLVIDPLAVRGDRWFLGRIFYYPAPGRYFGVPIANFAGWAVLGTAIAGIWLALSPRMGATPPRWGGRLRARPYHAVGLYYAVLGFNLALTARVAEPSLFWVGIGLQLPVVLLVVSSLSGVVRSHRPAAPAGRAA